MSSQTYNRRTSSTPLRFALFAFFLTTTLTQVSAKGGHYSAAVTDTSGPCIKRCSDIYATDLNSCENGFLNASQNSHDKDYCRLDAANAFQRCSASCIPAAASFTEK